MISLAQEFSGGEIDIRIQINAVVSGTVDIGLYYDGSLIKLFPGALGSSLGGSSWVNLFFRHQPTATTHTYRFDLMQKSGTTATVGERAIDITEYSGGYAVDTSGGSH